MLRTEIDKDELLYPGDVIEMHFKAFGPDWVYFRAAELALLKWRMEKKNPDYMLVGWGVPGDKIIMKFRILEPKEAVGQMQQAGIAMAAIIAVAVIGGGLFAWLALDKVYKISTSTGAQVAMAGGGAVSLVFAVFVGYLVLTYALGYAKK